MTHTISTDVSKLLRELAYDLSGTDPEQVKAMLQVAANRIDGLQAEITRLTEAITKVKAEKPSAWILTDCVGDRYLCFCEPTGLYPKDKVEPLYLGTPL